jgi:hypothetical protein
MSEIFLIIRRIFSTDFRNILNSNFMKDRPVDAEVFYVDGRTDRQTDRTKIIICFAILLTRLNRSKREAVLNVEFKEIQ